MRRTVAAVLALAGCGLVLAATFVPLSRVEGFSFRLVEVHPEPKSTLFFGAETLFVAAAAGTIAVLLLVRPSRWLAPVLVAIGAQTMFFFASFVGWLALDGDPAATPASGSFIGAAGAAAILAAGVVGWVARAPARAVTSSLTAPARAPAGWYPDPAGAARLRYWSGDDWTDRTRG